MEYLDAESLRKEAFELSRIFIRTGLGDANNQYEMSVFINACRLAMLSAYRCMDDGTMELYVLDLDPKEFDEHSKPSD